MNGREENRQLVRKFLDAISNWDVELLRTTTHRDFCVVLPGSSGLPATISGQDFYDLLEIFKQVVPQGISFDIIESTAEGDRVASAVNGTSKIFDGKDYNNQYHMLDYIADGKIIKHVEYMDTYLAATVLVPGFEKFGFKRT